MTTTTNNPTVSDYLSNTGLEFTPEADLKYIYLARPDDKFGTPKYSVTVILEPEKDKAHKAYVNKLLKLNDEVAQEKIAEVKSGRKAYRVKDLLREEEDDEGEPTGRLLLKIQTQKVPIVIDSAKNQIGPNILGTVGSGSRGIVKVSWKKGTNSTQKTAGLIAYMNVYPGAPSVQILEVKQFEPTVQAEGGAPSTGGFTSVEGGFTVGVTTDDPATGGNF